MRNPQANGRAGVFAFSRDSKSLAAGSHANTIHVWDVASGKALGPAGGHQAPVMGVAFCADGKMVVIGGQSRGRGRELLSW